METKLFRKIFKGMEVYNITDMDAWDIYTKLKQSAPDFRAYAKRFDVTEKELAFVNLEFSTDKEAGSYCAQYIYALRRLKGKTNISIKCIKSLKEMFNDIVFKYGEYLSSKYGIEIGCFNQSYNFIKNYKYNWFDFLEASVEHSNSENKCIDDILQEFEESFVTILKLMYVGQ